MASVSGATSSNSISSLMNSTNMISGLASGLDTESMIEGLVKSYQTKINTLNQKVTKVEWKQDAYRSIIQKMVGFSSKYASYTSSSNLTSPSFFNGAVKVSTLGLFADRVAASGKTNSDISLDRVTQLATSAQYRTSGGMKAGDGKSIEAVEGLDLLNGTTELGKLNGSLSLTYGSKTVSILFDQVNDVKELEKIKEKNQGISESEALGKLIEQKLADEKITFNSGLTETADKRIKVNVSGGNISFQELGGAGNGLYISGASGNVESVLGLNLDNAGEDKPTSFDLSGGLQTSLTQDVKNSEYLSGQTMNLSLDGVSKQIKMPTIFNGKFVDANYNPLKDADGNDISEVNIDNYTKALDGAVQKAFKGNKISVTNADTTGNTLKLRFEVQEGSDLVINTGVGDTLGIGQTATSYLNTSKTLGELLGDKLGTNMSQAYERDENGYYKQDASGNRILLKDDKGDPMYDFEINGVVVGSYSKNSTLSEVLSDINSNSKAGVRVSYSQTTKNFLFTSKETGLQSEISFGKGLAQTVFGSTSMEVDTNLATADYLGDRLKGSLTDPDKSFSMEVGNQKIDFRFNSNTGTLSQMLDKVNSNLKNAGIDAKASFDSKGGLVLTDSSGNQVNYKAEGENNIAAMLAKPQLDYTAGQDAKFTVTVNGEQKEMTRSSNTVTIDGLSITMKDVFDGYKSEDGKDAITSTGKPQNSVTFKSTTDSDKIVDTVKSMIDDYNTMMTEIKAAYSTLPYQKSDGSFGSYEPLTDEDREGMSESAIERYEEKAKQGILFNDRNLSALYDKMRNVFAGTNEAALRSMGITISYSISENTQAVTLDEDKLRSVLESDPERVTQTFTGESGVMQNMKSTLDTYSKTTGEPKGILIQQAGSPLSSLSLMNNSWQKEIDSLNTLIEKWRDKLTSQVERYTSQFSRLEVLINQMNSQSSTLAGLMGGG